MSFRVRPAALSQFLYYLSSDELISHPSRVHAVLFGADSLGVRDALT